MSQKEQIGIIDITGKEALISIQTGSFKELKYRISSGIPSNHNQGGASQGRFRRKRQEAIKSFCKRVVKQTQQLGIERWEYTGNEKLINIIKNK